MLIRLICALIGGFLIGSGLMAGIWKKVDERWVKLGRFECDGTRYKLERID